MNDRLPFLGILETPEGEYYDIASGSIILSKDIKSTMAPFYSVFIDKDGNEHDIREYLGGGVEPVVKNLPWCRGLFENKNMVANTSTLFKPIVTSGNNEMVKNSEFIIPEDGIYYLNICSGILPAAITNSGSVSILYKDESIYIPFNRSMILPGISTTLYFNKGDKITFNALSDVDQSSFIIQPTFTFECIMLKKHVI